MRLWLETQFPNQQAKCDRWLPILTAQDIDEPSDISRFSENSWASLILPPLLKDVLTQEMRKSSDTSATRSDNLSVAAEDVKVAPPLQSSMKTNNSALEAVRCKWQNIFCEDLALYNTQHSKQEAVTIKLPSGHKETCIVMCAWCPNATRVLHVRDNIAYRAKSFIDSHLGSEGHKRNYNQKHTAHLYLFAEDAEKETKKPNAISNSDKVDKELQCDLIAAKFERHTEAAVVGLRCKNCQLFVKCCNAFKGNVGQHLAKSCKSKKRKAEGADLSTLHKKSKSASGLHCLFVFVPIACL
jgi:hypothetical protein